MWIRALNGVVLEVPDSKASEYVEQGHAAFSTEAEARGKSGPVKAPVKRKN